MGICDQKHTSVRYHIELELFLENHSLQTKQELAVETFDQEASVRSLVASMEVVHVLAEDD